MQLDIFRLFFLYFTDFIIEFLFYMLKHNLTGQGEAI